MRTQQAQIKINLPLSLKELLEIRANQFGVSTAWYVKHLIVKDAEKEEQKNTLNRSQKA